MYHIEFQIRVSVNKGSRMFVIHQILSSYYAKTIRILVTIEAEKL